MPWSYETVRSQYWRMAYAGEREISLFSGVFFVGKAGNAPAWW